MTANTRKKNEPFLSWFKKQAGACHGVFEARGEAEREWQGLPPYSRADVGNRMPSRRTLAV